MATEQSVLAVIRASKPQFRNLADKVAFAVHSIFLATGFNLNATGPPAFTDDALTAPFSEWNGVLRELECKRFEKLAEWLGNLHPDSLKIPFHYVKRTYPNGSERIMELPAIDEDQGLLIPFNVVGGDDLYPQPPAGMYPTRGPFGDGGMLFGPNDPRFFDGGVGGRMGFPGGQPGVPPGARFDPFGPPNVPGLEPNRFTRNPRRPPGGTHPDLEHFNNGPDFI